MGYILPIRYRSDDAYSRMRRSIGRRFHRQATSPTLEDHWDNIKSIAAKAGEAFANPSDAIKESVSKMSSHAQDLKERIEKMMPSSDGDSAKERMEKIIAAFHPDKLKEHFTKLTDKIDTNELKERISKIISSIDTDAIKDKISKITDPIIGHASNMIQNPDEFFQGFKENFAVPVSRSKRSVGDEAKESSDDNDQDYASDESDETEEINEKRYPMLKVKDPQMPCETITNLKKMSTTRVELRSPESLQYVPELDIGDTVELPQYVEYVNGEAVSYQPRRFDEVKEKSSSDVRESPAARVVFDRYGHRYFENNGNLRLVRPEYQEAVVGAQPNFAGLADILNQNREVLDELNPLSDPTRLTPQPIEIGRDGIAVIRDIVRRNADYRYKVDDAKAELKKKKKFLEQKSKAEKDDAPKLELNEAPKSIYQMFPMNVDDNEGKLLVRVYSAKDAKDVNHASDDRNQVKRPAPRPAIRKMTRGNQDFEVITFDESPNSSNEEVQQIYQLYYNDSEPQNAENQ